MLRKVKGAQVPDQSQHCFIELQDPHQSRTRTEFAYLSLRIFRILAKWVATTEILNLPSSHWFTFMFLLNEEPCTFRLLGDFIFLN